MTTFEEAADQVYAATPKEFVATRTALVAALKADGEKDLAKQVTALRRPTTAAWLVNLLVREAGEQIDALLELGAAMRHAQSRLSADDLRKLTVQRQQVVRALAGQAHALAADLGENVSRDVLHQVQDTLQAGLADPELAEQVRQGRLTTSLSYSGFGPAGLTLVRTPPPAAQDESEPGSAADQTDAEAAEADAAAEAAARAERQREIEEAKLAVDAAARTVVRAQRAVVTAGESLRRADRELARAQQTVAERQAALEEANTAEERARARHERSAQEQEEADQRHAEATMALQRCKRVVEELISTTDA